jgi:hypothetical protein
MFLAQNRLHKNGIQVNYCTVLMAIRTLKIWQGSGEDGLPIEAFAYGGLAIHLTWL